MIMPRSFQCVLLVVGALLTLDSARASIFFRGGTAANNGGGAASLTITMPRAVNGDVLLMSVTVVGGTGTTITTPAGWTLVSSVDSTTALKQAIYWRIASSEPSSYTVSFTSNKASGTIVSLAGAGKSALVAAQYGGSANASSTTFSAPALGSWTSQNGMRLIFGGTAVGTTTATAAAGFLKIAESASTGNGVNSRTTSAVQIATDSSVTTEAAVSAASFWSAAAVQVDHQVFVYEDQFPTVVLNTADASSFTTATPTLQYTGTDSDGDDVHYEFQIDAANTFNSSATSVVDSGSSTTSTASIGLSGSGTTAVGQSFTSNGGTLTSVQFYLWQSTSATGTMNAKLYAHSGVFGLSSVPTGSPLAVSDGIDASAITGTGSTSASLTTFNFSGAQQVALTPGSNYVVTFEYSGANNVDIIVYGSDLIDGNGVMNSGSWIGVTVPANGWGDARFSVLVRRSTIDKVSSTDAGFLDTVNGLDSDPFTSGNANSYTVQAANSLSNGTYYWRARAIDNGQSYYGAWSTIRSFTISGLSSTQGPKHRVTQH